MTLEEIKQEVEMMQADLETVLPTEGNAAVERGTTLAAYLARTGTLLAEAKRMARRVKSSKIAGEIIKITKEGYLSKNAQNAMIDSLAEDEMYLVDALDRLNSACVHQMDFLRSIISKEKTEMQYLNWQSTNNK